MEYTEASAAASVLALDRTLAAAEQPNSRTAEQPNSRTAEQPNSRTAEQPALLRLCSLCGAAAELDAVLQGFDYCVDDA
ncbi:hypothetical protein [Streptomyces sp. NPDC057363]|uniref:hypothetical protein n=1 Tax=Streptomyces sp. NPDC057363 TaxID=3346107 RepID=UPI003633EB78